MAIQPIKRLRGTCEGMILQDIDTGRRVKIIKKDCNTVTLNNGKRISTKTARQFYMHVVIPNLTIR